MNDRCLLVLRAVIVIDNVGRHRRPKADVKSIRMPGTAFQKCK
jgi:hypothetical protein